MREKKEFSLLALGAESAGNFSVYFKGKLYLSENYGDLLEEKNFERFKKKLFQYIRIHKIKPDIIITDLHPLYKTTLLGEKLSRKFKANHKKVQHHIAHIFSAIGDYTISNLKIQISKIPKKFIGIAADGTGYGLDGKIWGGEVFQVKSEKLKVKSLNAKFKMQNDNSKCKINKSQNIIVERVGSLENQLMIGGDLAVREPARTVVAILAKLKTKNEKRKTKIKNLKIITAKNDIYNFVKKYYTKNQFELLYNQLEQNFNCQETSSTGRVLDAVSVLLGFCGNKRNYKHEPVDLLEKNSTTPYEIKPEIIYDEKEEKYILLTTPLFEYLIKNITKDRKRLAATAQFYIAQGLYKIISNIQYPPTKSRVLDEVGTISNIQIIYFSGGMANNKIISSYLGNKGVYLSKKIPRGDAGISFGQIIFYLMNLRN